MGLASCKIDFWRSARRVFNVQKGLFFIQNDYNEKSSECARNVPSLWQWKRNWGKGVPANGACDALGGNCSKRGGALPHWNFEARKKVSCSKPASVQSQCAAAWEDGRWTTTDCVKATVLFLEQRGILNIEGCIRRRKKTTPGQWNTLPFKHHCLFPSSENWVCVNLLWFSSNPSQSCVLEDVTAAALATGSDYSYPWDKWKTPHLQENGMFSAYSTTSKPIQASST